MRRFFLPLLVAICLVTLQTTLMVFLPVQRVRPDFLLILALYLGLSYPPVSGGVLALLTGYLMDLFSGSALGFFTLTRVLLFYGVQLYRRRFYLEGFVFQFLLAFGAMFVEGAMLLILSAALNRPFSTELYASLFGLLLPQSLMTGLLAPPILSLFEKGSIVVFGRPEISLKEKP